MTAIVFDAYGTLFDLNELVKPTTNVLGDARAAEQLCQAWRTKHLEYAWTSVLMQRFQDFDKLSMLALDYGLSQVNRQLSQTDKEALLAAQRRMPLYDDARTVLETLSDYQLAILSNGTFRSLQSLAEHAGVLFTFDYVLSVEPLRTYKPARPAYQLAVDKLGGSKTDIVFVSSNAWDVAGAKSFGFRTIWCNRKDESFVSVAPKPDAVIHSLHELPNALTFA